MGDPFKSSGPPFKATFGGPCLLCNYMFSEGDTIRSFSVGEYAHADCKLEGKKRDAAREMRATAMAAEAERLRMEAFERQEKLLASIGLKIADDEVSVDSRASALMAVLDKSMRRQPEAVQRRFLDMLAKAFKEAIGSPTDCTICSSEVSLGQAAVLTEDGLVHYSCSKKSTNVASVASATRKIME